MMIRLATKADYKGVACSLRNKNIEYITSSHAKNDIENQCLFVMEEEGKIIAQCALVREAAYNYYAIKRLVVYNKKNCGRGIAEKFITFFCEKDIPTLGCTPWKDNAVMKKLLERNGFVYQYTFLENYQFYKRA